MASPQQSFLSKLMGGNQLQLTPSPERSRLVQLLQQQSAQPQQSFSTIGSLNIASKPILAALLARQEQQGRQNELDSQRQGLAAALGVDNLRHEIPIQTLEGGTETFTPERAGVTPQQRQLEGLVNSLGPEGLGALGAGLVSETLQDRNRPKEVAAEEQLIEARAGAEEGLIGVRSTEQRRTNAEQNAHDLRLQLQKSQFDIGLAELQQGHARENQIRNIQAEIDLQNARYDHEKSLQALELSNATGRPISSADMETLTQSFNALTFLDIMRENMGAGEEDNWWNGTGWAQGAVRLGMAELGLAPGAVAFQTARNQYRLAAQAMIKGIPSNFDVQTVIATIPNLLRGEAINVARLDLGEQLFKDLVRGNIAFHKTNGQSVPEDVLRRAREFGIDVDSVGELSHGEDPFQEAIDRAGGANDASSVLNQLRDEQG